MSGERVIYYLPFTDEHNPSPPPPGPVQTPQAVKDWPEQNAHRCTPLPPGSASSKEELMPHWRL